MQKIMIVSDTHRRHENLAKALEIEGHIDMLIHLGDAEGEEDYIRELAGCELVIIAGNSDFFSMLDREITMQLGKYQVLLTHGNYYYVTVGLDMIRKEALGREMDIVMFGHTHRPLIDYGEDGNGPILLNPGSISYPRQDDKLPSYMIMEINDAGNAKFYLNYIGE